MNFFGKKRVSAPAAPAVKDSTTTIVQLRESIVTMEKRREHIQKKADRAVDDAKKKLAAKPQDKKGALFCMKQKKMYEAEVEKVGNAMFTLEQQVMALESQQQNIETFKAMKLGKDQMEAQRKGIDVDKVEDLMDDIKDEMQQAEEIGTALGGSIAEDGLDDDELLAELNELEEDDLESKMLGEPSTGVDYQFPDAALPSAPSGRLPQKATEESEEEAALRELEASMAM
jgi:charged multivesicular body protein 4